MRLCGPGAGQCLGQPAAGGIDVDVITSATFTCCQKLSRVRVRRHRVEDLGWSDLHQLAVLHDRHAMGGVADDVELVGDEQGAEAMLAAAGP